MTQVWEKRVRAPALASWSLLAPAASWAADSSPHGVLLATLSGRVEVYAFDASVVPARLTQVTSRDQGTTGAAIAPDGGSVYWFDDDHGSELGRWVRHPMDGGGEVTLLEHLPPAYGSGGFQSCRAGVCVVGRLVEEGFELAVAGPEGAGSVRYASPEPAALVDATPDAGLALLAYAPGGDWLHLGVRVVDLRTAAVTAELSDPGRNLDPVGFAPDDPAWVLLAREPDDRVRPVLWNTASGERVDVETGLAGDVHARWYPDSQALLLTALQNARHGLARWDRSSGRVTVLAEGFGTAAVASARPDGSIEALLSRSDRPVSLVRVDAGRIIDLVDLPGAPPPPTVPATDVFAEGPGGRVHGLLSLPVTGRPPFPAVVQVHGGPTAQDFDAWNDGAAAFTDLGYAVLRVNYRGSTGYGAAWRDALHRRLGFIELEDVAAVREVLERDKVIDPDRVSIVGGSWGGFLTLMALGLHPEHWRSGVALVPLADWFTYAEDAPAFMQAYDRSLFGGSIERLPDAYRESSPITYVDAVTAPVFVTAGANDPRCPARQVDSYVAALRARGHDVTYLREDTGHGLPDLDLKVEEMRAYLAFLEETNPPGERE